MAGGIRNKSNPDDLEMTHEINVTPFIDVMLVLLIIFMVAAPLSTVDIHVDLPASSAKTQKRPDKPIYVTLKEDLSLNVGVTPVTRDSLAGMLGQTSDGDKETRIFLRADRSVAYGDIMQVMNLLRDAGYLKIALVGLETPSAVNSVGGAEADDGAQSGAGEPAPQP